MEKRRLRMIAMHVSPSVASSTTSPESLVSSEERLPVVIGAMVMDVHATPSSDCPCRGTTTPGKVKYHHGGVGRNVAECMARLHSKPFLISVVGQDMAGEQLVQHWKSLGLRVDGIRRFAGASTPVVSAVFDKHGEIAAAVADVGTIEKHLSPEWIQQFVHRIRCAPIVMLDANLLPESLDVACKLAYEATVPIWFEPVSVSKSVRIAKLLHMITYASPNEAELVAMAEAVTNGAESREYVTSTNKLQSGAHELEAHVYELRHSIKTVLAAGLRFLVLTMGHHGAVLCSPHPLGSSESQNGGEKSGSSVFCYHIPALPASVVSLSGAGDCLVAGALSALARDAPIEAAVGCGIAAAKEAVESESNVPARLLSAAFRGDASFGTQSVHLLVIL